MEEEHEASVSRSKSGSNNLTRFTKSKSGSMSKSRSSRAVKKFRFVYKVLEDRGPAQTVAITPKPAGADTIRPFSNS